MRICPAKKNDFLRPILSRRPALKSQGPWCRAIRRRGSDCSNRASPVGNKSQQITAEDFLPEATNINRNQQKSTRVSKSQQKSAKSVPVHECSQQKSAKIIRNHQKSSPVWTVVIKNHQ
jgi:hypothetical protein